MKNLSEAYHLSQKAVANLKASVFFIISINNEGIVNAVNGRSLGIYYVHSGKHEGHISLVILELL